MSKNMHPVSEAISVTPDDATDLTQTCRAIYVGISGDVRLTLSSGNVITLSSLVAGVIHPIEHVRVWSTGTTATNIISFP